MMDGLRKNQPYFAMKFQVKRVIIYITNTRKLQLFIVKQVHCCTILQMKVMTEAKSFRCVRGNVQSVMLGFVNPNFSSDTKGKDLVT